MQAAARCDSQHAKISVNLPECSTDYQLRIMIEKTEIFKINPCNVSVLKQENVSYNINANLSIPRERDIYNLTFKLVRNHETTRKYFHINCLKGL